MTRKPSCLRTIDRACTVCGTTFTAFTNQPRCVRCPECQRAYRAGRERERKQHQYKARSEVRTSNPAQMWRIIIDPQADTPLGWPRNAQFTRYEINRAKFSKGTVFENVKDPERQLKL